MSSGRKLRLVRLQLEGYGRLREFELEPDPRPGTVVLAPNEAGKTTLVSAIHRGLFGFEDKSREDARRPWEAGPFRVTQRWRLGSDTLCSIVRDFDTQEVSVEWRRRTRRGRTILDRRWEGTPNPRGRSVELAEYQAELRRLLGFSSPQIFRQTVLIGPGDPDVRPLGGELLRLLSGGEHADFRSALETLAAGYHELTQADLEDPMRQSKHKPRRIELMESRRRELERRRAVALDVEASRSRAEEELARKKAEMERIDGEVTERARGKEAIASLRRVRAELVACEHRLAELDGQTDRFRQWEETFRDRELQLRPLAPYVGKPVDYGEQLGEIERLDRRIGELGERPRKPPKSARRGSTDPTVGRRRARVMAWSSGAWILAGVAAGLLGTPRGIAAAIVAVGIALLAGSAWVAFGARRPGVSAPPRPEDDLAELERKRRRLAAELGLAPGEDPAAERERYRHAQRLRDQLDGMKETHGALGDRVALERERQRLKEERLDVLRLEERRILESHAWLTRDPDFERRFLSETASLEERAVALRRELIETERRLASLPVADDDPIRLAEEIANLDRARAEAELERDAHRLAYQTLLGCKNEFVRVATTRLARDIGAVFADLSGGRYTEVRIDPQRFDIYVDGPERLDVPAADLSRGAQDQLYFALRVAIVEALAPDRALPLVLDDPFLHFDEERLGLAGRMLRRLGERHQILLLTHDRRLAEWELPQRVLPGTPAPAYPSGD